MEREYLKFMKYVINLIDEIGDVIEDGKPDENLFDCLELVFEHVRSTLLSNGSEVLYNNI